MTTTQRKKGKLKKIYVKVKQWKEWESCLERCIPKLSRGTEFSPENIYQSLDSEDKKLADLWMPNTEDVDYHMARMLSARAGEKVAARFYQSLGFEVKDISLTQLNDSDDWKSHDLLLDNGKAIDVKNARTPVNNEDYYVKHCVPRFKENRAGNDVYIAGVLSPYWKREYLEDPSSRNRSSRPITFLGETSQEIFNDLVKKYSRGNRLEIANENNTIPPWVFNYPIKFYEDYILLRKAIYYKSVKEIPEKYWKRFNPIPTFLAAGIDLPKKWSTKLPEWQVEVYKTLLRASEDKIIPLPDIFLTILTHFLEMVRSVDVNGYSPSCYKRLLYTQEKWKYPAGTLDPLQIVQSLIETLETLWQNKETIAFEEYKSYRLCCHGILQGVRRKDGKRITLIAYCGGWIPKKGKCGNFPLVKGKEKTCHECGKLICNKCDFCSENCKRMIDKETCQV